MTPEEEKLRFENEFKKLKLVAEFGANFFTEGSEKLPVGVESEWLDNIATFEKAFSDAKTCKIGDLLGNPTFPEIETIPDNDLSDLLYALQLQLAEKRIVIDVIYDVPQREIYRFITEELMQHEIEVIDVPDMISHISYEEFHPNDEEDLKRYVMEFFELIEKKEFRFMEGVLSSECIDRGAAKSSEQLIQLISDKRDLIEQLSLKDTKDYVIQIDNDKAYVTCQLSYAIKPYHRPESTIVEQVRLDFVHEFDYWYINEISIPGLEL